MLSLYPASGCFPKAQVAFFRSAAPGPVPRPTRVRPRGAQCGERGGQAGQFLQLLSKDVVDVACFTVQCFQIRSRLPPVPEGPDWAAFRQRLLMPPSDGYSCLVQKCNAVKRRVCFTYARGNFPKCDGQTWHRFNIESAQAFGPQRHELRATSQGISACQSVL